MHACFKWLHALVSHKKPPSASPRLGPLPPAQSAFPYAPKQTSAPRTSRAQAPRTTPLPSPADAGSIQRDVKQKPRTYTLVLEGQRRKQRLTRLCTLGACALLLFSGAKLLHYGLDYFNARRASASLREIYYEQTPESATALPSATPTAVVTRAASSATAMPTVSPTPATMLSAIPYPDNPYGVVRSRFQKIRRQNSDIIGWLTIPDLIDEAVVQRDNTYYMNRDYRGYHNVNGAIFLEQTCNLSTRPYTLMLYGHNMKTGAMFGSLRNYENLAFYRKNPFITFDTAYEDGRYVIFAVATISTRSWDGTYIDFNRLNSTQIALRQQELDTLVKLSVYRTALSVAPEDQLLLLITCAAEDKDRRIVAARRIRPDETEQALQDIVQKAIPN